MPRTERDRRCLPPWVNERRRRRLQSLEQPLPLATAPPVLRGAPKRVAQRRALIPSGLALPTRDGSGPAHSYSRLPGGERNCRQSRERCHGLPLRLLEPVSGSPSPPAARRFLPSATDDF